MLSLKSFLHGGNVEMYYYCELDLTINAKTKRNQYDNLKLLKILNTYFYKELAILISKYIKITLIKINTYLDKRENLDVLYINTNIINYECSYANNFYKKYNNTNLNYFNYENYNIYRSSVIINNKDDVIKNISFNIHDKKLNLTREKFYYISFFTTKSIRNIFFDQNNFFQNHNFIMSPNNELNVKNANNFSKLISKTLCTEKCYINRQKLVTKILNTACINDIVIISNIASDCYRVELYLLLICPYIFYLNILDEMEQQKYVLKKLFSK
jgi:hypothetical protein